MTVALVLAGLYLTVAAFGYWVMVSASKVGIRQTWGDVARTMRREGVELALLSLAWLPLIVSAWIRATMERRPADAGTFHTRGTKEHR